jgi:hypothetical protein
MNWTAFEKKHEFEKVVFELTLQSLALLSKSEFSNETFSAFAFNCASFGGNISLSFDTNTNNKEEQLYPPDWTNECMEYDIPEIGELWKAQYGAIETAHSNIVKNTEDYDFIDEFELGYLTSLRKVMVKLEINNAFEKIKTTDDFWTLVTQVDADTDEEEDLLGQIRKDFKS